MAEAGAPSLLERLGLHRPELRAWAMYDWANSAFVTTMIAAVFPAYFSHVTAADLPPEEATARFATRHGGCPSHRELRVYKQAMPMLIAFLIYNDGIQTIIRMADIYGAEIGLTEHAMIPSLLLTQFIGIPCAFLFGMLAGQNRATGSSRGTVLL